MRRIVYVFTFVILAAMFGAAVSAEEVTLEPTLPLPVTVVLTVEPPIVTTQPTNQPTTQPTNAATAEATTQPTQVGTAEPTSEGTMQATAEATSEMQVTAQVTSLPSATSGYLRVAHFVPDSEGVDVYLNGTLYYKNLIYKSISEWLAVAPDTYSIAVVPTGKSVSDTVFTPLKVSADSGMWKTIAIVGSANSGTLQAAIITEDYSDLLPSTGGFTFFNAVEGSDPVNLVRDNAVYFAQVSFPSADASFSSSLVGDAGTFAVNVVDPNNPSTVFAQNAGLELAENAYTFVALIGTKDDPLLFIHVTDESAVEIAQGTLPVPGTLVNALRANDNLTSFADAIQSAGLTDLLTDSTEYTIFAPANFALDMTSMTSEQQADALRSYIVKGKYTSKEIVDAGTLIALDGTTLTITTDANAIFVNGVQLIDVNIAAINGVIHMLNGDWSSAPAK